ncbi:hypothetical protein [Flagellimonas aequoris]|uniref:Uncharacterized protein n=1 Tax=Flagellimonas aequoris TaxID=2306997 RepID=A0A418NAZ1_9FLAO|nr:hypothetical protein [Allomuricauda aequoris]RIV73094.1 hypothetical protein D2U88_02815 [Allomuricauda aequoris]TXK06900.1 hypothetical protein FQ019_02795 [Allomuricauda aequoris]
MTDNKELYSALFDLEKELNSLKSAKQQIEEVIAIGNNVVKGFEVLNNNYSEYLSGLGDDYQSKLELLANTVAEIKTKQATFSEELKDISSSFIKKQSESNELNQKNLMLSTKSLIDELITSLNNTINSTTEVYQNQNQKINEQLDFYNSFVSKVEQLTTIIGSVDFPNRLDKLDNTVSAINIGIQNNQAKLDELNNSVRKELGETVSKINQGFENLEDHIKTKSRNTIIAVGIGIVLSLGILFKLLM